MMDDLEVEGTETLLHKIRMLKSLEFKRRLPQFGAAFSATILAFAGGCVLGWSAPASIELTNSSLTSYPFELTEEEFSWVGSTFNLGALVACIPCGILIDSIGRKYTSLLLIIPGLIGWGLILGAQNMEMMIAGRVFLGMFAGPVFVVTPLYIAEIAEKEIRGILGTFLQLLLSSGLLFVYIIGGLALNVFWTSLVCATFLILFGVSFIKMPETSTYLVMKNKIDEAEKSLKWLRGKDYDPQPDILQLQEAERERKLLNENRSLRTSFSRPESLRALMLVLGMIFFLQFTGINAFTFYSTDIFVAANSHIQAEWETIISSIVEVLMTFVATLLVDKLGRKPLLIFSAVLMGFCCIAMGVYFQLANENADSVTNLGWLPITSVSLYVIAYSVGFGPLPFVVISELCAEDIKGVAVGAALTFNWILSFLITKYFTNMVNGIGIGPTFYMFGACCILATLYIIFLLPETRGIELWEIQVKLGAKPIEDTEMKEINQTLNKE